MEDKAKCEICNREFDSKEALDMHNNSKHFESIKKSLKINKKKVMNWAVFFAIVGLIVLLVVVSSKPKTLGGGDYDVFSQCLADAGLKMYGTEWCPHCQNQKKMFGKSFDFVNYIDCDKNRDICLAEGIQGYPTWKFDGESYTGTQELEVLADITGCEIP